MSKTNTPWKGFIVAAALLLSTTGGSAWGGTVSGCTADTCTWAISLDGQTVSTGSYDTDSAGNIIFSKQEYDAGGGTTVSLNNITGNIDPILGFGVGASTGGSGSTFGFTLNLPIALQGLINANSSVSYSLTSLTSAGAQIAPVVGSNIVSAYEVDTSIGGKPALNKGVDVGNTFFFVGGPLTQNSSVFTASNSFSGDLAYDLMTVKIDFSLSANSAVGLSGFVQQTPVPIPAAVWLFGSGMLGIVGIARRRAA
jgi:hypothetical protein